MNQRIIAGIKEARKIRISESGREKLHTPRNMHGLIEHLINEIKHIQSGRANPRSSKAT